MLSMKCKTSQFNFPESSKHRSMFNPDKHLIFSKLEFGNEEDQRLLKKKERRRFKDIPTGKQYDVLLKKIDKIEEDISILKEKDIDLAEERKIKLLWRKALAKSAGFVVTDKDYAQKMLERKENRKKESKVQWEERLKKVEKQKRERQLKRKENIKKRVSKNTKNKINKKI